MSRQLPRRQRRERLAGIALAALGVVVLIVAVIALRSPNGHGAAAGPAPASSAAVGATPPPATSSPATSSPATSSSATSATGRTGPASPAPGNVALVVLNNTHVTGLAQQAKARFEAGGWTVTGTGDLRADIRSTCAYFDPAVAGAEAGAQALQAQFPAIKRVVPKFAQLPPGPIVVVLTTDYS